MNKKFKYWIAFLLLGVISVLLLWPKESQTKESGDDEIPPKTSRNTESSDQKNLFNETPVRDRLSADQLRQIGKETEQTKLEKMKETLRRDYSTPIDFWGKVVDQDGNPIAGVKAEIVVDQLGENEEYVVFFRQRRTV